MLLSFSLLCYPQNKESLTEKVLIQAKDFSDIAPVLDIIETQIKIYNYVPHLHPIAPKNKPIITSYFGLRYHPIDRETKGHAGIDFISSFATSIHSTAKGKVTFAGIKGGYGKCVIIEHKYGFETIYGHLTGYYVKVGQEVNKGKIIGFLGSTGKSTGAHLHYEIRKNGSAINPLPFLPKQT